MIELVVNFLGMTHQFLPERSLVGATTCPRGWSVLSRAIGSADCSVLTTDWTPELDLLPNKTSFFVTPLPSMMFRCVRMDHLARGC